MGDGDFSLKRFLRELEISKDEQPILKECLSRGVERYQRHLYGFDRYGRQPAAKLLEHLREPYVFGFAAVEVVREPALTLETRLKVVEYAFQRMRPLEEYGTPHGLPALLSFLATVGGLEMQLLRSAMKLVDIEQRLFDDWTFEEARALIDWLISTGDLPDDERLWWLWYILAHCGAAHTGKLLVEHVVSHPVFDAPAKRSLFHALLAGEQAGEPPDEWVAFDAALSGDAEALQATLDAAADEGLDVEETASQESELPDDFVPSFGLFRHMAMSEFGAAPALVPNYLKRQAVLALAHLGGDTLDLCNRYLDANRDYHADAVNQGVADVIREYSAWLSREEVRSLIERGLGVPKVNTRKAYYQLGADFFGHEYWERALKDNANSIRRWAARQSNRGPQQAVDRHKRGTSPGRRAAHSA